MNKFRTIEEGGLWLAYQAGSVITRTGETPLLRMPMAVETKQVGDKDSRVLRFVASTEDEDRDGDIIRAEGWDVGNFLKNPVQLWAHNMRIDHPPIGKTIKLEVGNGKLVNEVDFFMAGDFELARLALKAHLAGVGAESVGFRPIKAVERRGGDGRLMGFEFQEQELLEISSVPVPSNPNALLAATQKGLLKPEEAEAIEKAFAPHLVKPIRIYLTSSGPAVGKLSDGDRAEIATLMTSVLEEHVKTHHIPGAPKPKKDDEEVDLKTAFAAFEEGRKDEAPWNAEQFQSWLDEQLKGILSEDEWKQERKPTTVQTLIFSKDKFPTAKSAKAWAKEHDFRSDKVDETEDSWRLRQRDPGDFEEGSFRTITLTEGVKAVIGRLKEAKTAPTEEEALAGAAAEAAGLDEARRRAKQQHHLRMAEAYGLTLRIETADGDAEAAKAIEELTTAVTELQAQVKERDAIIAGTVRDAVGAAVAGR